MCSLSKSGHGHATEFNHFIKNQKALCAPSHAEGLAKRICYNPISSYIDLQYKIWNWVMPGVLNAYCIAVTIG